MNKDFLHVTDLNADELWDLLKLSNDLKHRFREGQDYQPFARRSLAMIFAKPSARTRVSFETGFEWMGGHALYLGPNDIGIGKREAIKDIARVFSRYNDIIMARLFEHKHMLELAEHATIPVVNGLTDYNHPCQIMADLFTIWEYRKSLDDLKITYVGDGNNIVHSWLRLAMLLPINFVCACPEDYAPDPETVRIARNAGLSEIEISHSLIDSVKGADIVYTDVWASMGQKHEVEEREKQFSEFQVTSEVMSATGKKNSLFMHCLPAERGREVTDEVIESSYSVVFDEAENRMHVQNAIMVMLHKNHNT